MTTAPARHTVLGSGPAGTALATGPVRRGHPVRLGDRSGNGPAIEGVERYAAVSVPGVTVEARNRPPGPPDRSTGMTTRNNAPVTAAEVRSAALSLPGTNEKLAWGQPTFRVAGTIFASLGDDDTAMGVKCPREDRAELIAAEPAKFFLEEGHDDHYAWMRVRLAALEDAGELAAILADAWRQAAPRRLLAAHPELEGPGEG